MSRSDKARKVGFGRLLQTSPDAASHERAGDGETEAGLAGADAADQGYIVLVGHEAAGGQIAQQKRARRLKYLRQRAQRACQTRNPC